MRSIVGAAVAAVALSGCIKLDADLRVQADDTIDGTFTVGISKDLARFLPGGIESLIAGADGEQDVAGAEDVTTTPYEDDKFIGQTVTFTGAPLDEAGSGLGTGDSGDLLIERDGDRFILEGTLDFTGDVGDLPIPQDQVPDLSQIFDEAEVRIRVTFPGEVIEANGDVDGCSVTWTPTFGDTVDLRATASATNGSCDSGGGFRWWSWLLIGFGGLVLIGAIVAIVLAVRAERRRGKARATHDAVPEAPPATSFEPPTGPPAASPTEPAAPDTQLPPPTPPA